MPTITNEQEFSYELKKRVAKSLKMVMVEFELSNKDLASMTAYISHLRNGKRLPNFENFINMNQENIRFKFNINNI